MSHDQDVRETVKRAYTEALARAKARTGGCYGGACEPVAEASKTAGYDAEREAYAEAAPSSFGCGNPLAFAGVREGETVLDLGSGAGLDLLIAADRVGPTGRVIGVDMTDAMVEEARRTAARAGKDWIEVRRGTIEDLPVEDASVDWVISNCVINLSPEKAKVFAEIARVLRPGGRVSVSDIVAQDLPPVLRDSAAAYAACIAGAIPETDYVAGLEAAGLIDVEASERLVYDEDQLRAMVGSERVPDGIDPQALTAAVPQVVGRVWSARFFARKP